MPRTGPQASFWRGAPGQQTLIEKLLGIEKGAPLDTPSIAEVGDVAGDIWGRLSKAPQPAPAAPTAPFGPPESMATPAAPTTPTAMTPRYGQPFGANTAMSAPRAGEYDLPTQMPGMRVRGTASGAGPRAADVLGPSSPLQALKEAGDTRMQQQPYIPTEELYRSAFNEPEFKTAVGGVYRAPSSQKWAQQELQERTGTDEFQRMLGMKQQEVVGQAEAQMHPTAQAAAEVEARRKAYPSQAQAEGLAESADIQAEASLQKALLEARQGNLNSLRQLLGPLANAFADIVTGPDEDMAAEAYGVLLDILKRGSGAGAF